MLEKFISYFVDRHLLTNLMFLLVFVGGIFAWNNTSKEEMPDLAFDFVRVSASYPGATAEEVEHFVTKPIEQELKGIDGVYSINSTSSDGSTSISVELEKNIDRDEVIMEIKNTVLDVKLPDDVTNEPRVRVFKTSKKAIIDIAVIDSRIHMLDDKSRKELQSYSYLIENQLLSLPEVNSVNRDGYLQEELRIMAKPDKLRYFDIPFNTVMSEIRNNHVRQPAGNIETIREPKVTLISELDTVEKLKKLTVQGGFEGQVVRLEQIADIKATFQKNKAIRKINGHEGIVLNVVKSSSYGILEALEAVQNKIKILQQNNLENTSIELILLDDESIDLRNRLSLISINGAIGFLLILLILFMFLNFKSGVWVAMGIPFTILFSMICVYFMGYTINNITLAGVIIVMGMIVDDAIVVSENISRFSYKGMSAKEASVKGTAMVFFPIIASIITTCIAFIPLFFFKGRFGQVNKFIPPVIFFMLGASLFESLVILPGHMTLKFSFLKKIFKSNKAIDKTGTKHWFDKYEDKYAFLLEKLLPLKWIVIPCFVLLLFFSVYIVKTKMKYVMFPREETRELSLSGAVAAGTDRYKTALITKKIEDIMKPYIGKEFIGYRTSIARSRRGGAVEENKFRMRVEIVPKEKREKSADQLIKEIKLKTDNIPELTELKFAKSHWGQSSGSPIEISVQENNDKTRISIAEELASIMKQNKDLENVEIERSMVNPEYKIKLRREKIKRLAINPSDVSSTLRAALQGISLYELTSEDEEIDVVFTVVDSAKNNIDKILNIPIENRGDYLVPLNDIVIVEKTKTPNSITRTEGKRTLSVYADIASKADKTPIEIAEYFENSEFPAILSKYPSALIVFEGEVKDTRESQGDLFWAIITVLLLIYIVLVLLFNSLFKPFIIMLAIPFGVVGVILAFWLHGKVLFGFFAAIGALGLAGVVVNDSIIMLVKLDREYDRNKEYASSHLQIASIAKTRLRAVMLTTITTVAGIVPTAYGFAGYDAMLAEMMLALVWGLLFATVITLLLIPTVYSIGHDIKYFYSKNIGAKI